MTSKTVTTPTIAWLVPNLEEGGVLSAVILLGKALTDRGWKTPMVTLGEGPFTHELIAAGFQTVPLDVPEPPLFAGSLWSKPLQLGQAWQYQRKVLPLLESELRTIRR